MSSRTLTSSAKPQVQPLSSACGSDPQPGSVAITSSPSRVRLQVFSDLHHDVTPAPLPTLAPRVDLVVVPGDTCEGPQRTFALLRQAVPAPTPIVAVLGNHEHYRAFYSETLDEARRLAPAHGITLLENEAAMFAGVRLLGCTLWTDYRLDGADQQAAAMAQARHGMNDHRMIGWRKRPWQRFRPEETLALHLVSRRFLADALAEPYAGPTVVVTHHAPHPGSVHPRYAGDLLNPAFASDLTDLITAAQPALWLHGHVHSSIDYRVGVTRILCNPHGYGRENPAFDPQLVVEVAR